MAESEAAVAFGFAVDNGCSAWRSTLQAMLSTDSAHVALDRLRSSGAAGRLASRFGITLLVAFGSAVTSRQAADLDLAVLSGEPLDALALMDEA